MAEISFVPEAAEDYIGLDRSLRIEILKALTKLQMDPRGYGEPLGKRTNINLFGFYSIKAAGKRIRIIYSVGNDDQVIIRVIGRRERFEAHRTAQERIQAIADATDEELRRLDEVMKAAGDR